MKRLLTVSILLWSVGLLAAPAAVAGEASCLVRVVYDPNQLPLGHDRLNAIVGSSGVLGAAAQDAEGVMAFLKENETTLNDYVSAELRPSGNSNTGENVVFGRLRVAVAEEWRQTPLTDQQAQIILRGICERLRNVLTEIGQQDRERLAGRVAAAAKEVERATGRLSELHELQHVICAEAGQADLDRDLILHNSRGWRSEVRHMEMRLAGRAARRDALTEQIAEIAAQVEARVDEDPVLAELAKIVELREQQVARAHALTAENLSLPEEGVGAEEELARIRAEFAERRQAAADEAGGHLLREFNQELIGIALDVSETSAQLQMMQGMLAKASERRLMELADRAEREVSLYLPLVRSTVQRAIMEHEELTQRLRMYQPPAVTIIGGVE